MCVPSANGNDVNDIPPVQLFVAKHSYSLLRLFIIDIRSGLQYWKRAVGNNSLKNAANLLITRQTGRVLGLSTIRIFLPILEDLLTRKLTMAEHSVEVPEGTPIQWSPLTPVEQRRLELATKVSCWSALVGILLVLTAFIAGYLSGCESLPFTCFRSSVRDVLRVAAVVLFVIGFATVLIALYTNRKADALKRRQNTTLVSTVTRLGLTKSPTPLASLRSVNVIAGPEDVESISDSTDAQLGTSDLPEYDVVVNVVPSELTAPRQGSPAGQRAEGEDGLPNYEEALQLEEKGERSRSTKTETEDTPL